jgi:hypothetical protein
MGLLDGVSSTTAWAVRRHTYQLVVGGKPTRVPAGSQHIKSSEIATAEPGALPPMAYALTALTRVLRAKL